MKYIYLILLFFLVNSLVSGQSGIPLKLFVYPNISQPVYRSDGSAPQYITDSWKDLEIARMSYSIGLQAGLPLNEKWHLFSGANYMMTGYKNKEKELHPAVPEPLIPEYIKTTYTIAQIEIPIHIKRGIFQKEKINFYALAGPSLWFNIFHKKIVTSKYSDGRVEKEKVDDTSTDFKAVNLAASIGVGIEWPTNKKYSFYVQPMTQMGLLGMALDVPLNRDIFNFGIAAGIILK